MLPQVSGRAARTTRYLVRSTRRSNVSSTRRTRAPFGPSTRTSPRRRPRQSCAGKSKRCPGSQLRSDRRSHRLALAPNQPLVRHARMARPCGRSAVAWPDRVMMSGGAGPFASAVGMSGDSPAGVVFGVVVALAQRCYVVASCLTALTERFAMVEVAEPGGSSASREGAGVVAGDDVAGEVGWWPVGAAAVVE
jgi:hypothetical protein